MFARNLSALLNQPRTLFYEPCRYLRRGFTMPLKKSKPRKLTPRDLIDDKELLRSNKGIGYRLNLYKQHFPIDDEMGEDELDMLELGAEDMKPMVKQKLLDTEKEQIRKLHHNVKRKHFKQPPLPNMVTYIEKQEMKALNKEDPETWDPMALAESFPVNEEIAKKIISSPFKAYTTKDIRRHDKTVENNWKLFKEGSLELPHELHAHCNKFTNRSRLKWDEKTVKKYLPQPTNFTSHLSRTEFGSIIENYEKKTNTGKPPIEMDDNKIVYQGRSDNVRAISEEEGTDVYAEQYTLDQVREIILRRASRARAAAEGEVDEDEEGEEMEEEFSELDKIIVQAGKSEPIPLREPKQINAMDYLSEAYTVTDPNYRKMLPFFEGETYPERIRIPKSKRKFGELYRVKDRFYDHNGYFMYRVPGLFS